MTSPLTYLSEDLRQQVGRSPVLSDCVYFVPVIQRETCVKIMIYVAIFRPQFVCFDKQSAVSIFDNKNYYVLAQ